ncbi:CHAT domain-containing protein [Laspinema olomoucense]|uniref:CHAT domain-containing protein n=1 Tax=Laspinema olomoucense TaxID=3231600 RepID=UPI0021BB1900|nr:CHAT domain-containing protein [Laspinema sp. D3b]
MSQTISPQATPQQLMERGRELYRRGGYSDYSEAAEILRQAGDIYAAEGNRLNQSLALSYLSLSYQKLGQWEEAQRVSDASLQLAGMGGTRGDRIARAVALNSQGHLFLSLGEAETAFERWQKAADEYQQLNDKEGKIGALVNQAQALEQMGYYRRSCNTLLQAIGAENPSCDEIKTEEDIKLLQNRLAAENNGGLKTIALRSLGNVLRAIGYLEQSQQILNSTWEVVSQTNSNTDKSLTLFSLANTQKALSKQQEEYGDNPTAQNYRDKAVQNYNQAITLAPSSPIKLLAQLNLFSLLRQSETNTKELQTLLAQIQSQMSEMRLSKPLVEARIKLACSLMQCEKLVQGETAELELVSIEEIDGLLQQALTEAETLKDARLKSYAIGTQGKRYEYFVPPQAQKQGETTTWEKAKTLTQEALELAVKSNAPELRYQWQWQMGRLLAGEENLEDAINNYTVAVETLDSLRNDLLAVNTDVQFSFRDNVEPMYRQFVDLLLQSADGNRDRLQSAIQFIDALQLAELENFLQCNLSVSNSGQLLDSAARIERSLNEITRDAALIYPILLPNRIELLFKLPARPLERHIVPISRIEVQENVTQLRGKLANPSSLAERLESSDNLYRWLIQPLEPSLETSTEIKTLVFILDGELKNIPLAALYDRATEKYVVEKDYAIALLPNLQTFDLEQKSAQRRVLATGVTEALTVENKNFQALEVRTELESISNLVSTQILLNSEFTQPRLKQELNIGPFSIVHMATHGQFSSNPQNTYILVYGSADSTGELIRSNEFDRLLRDRSPSTTIELLVLSACKTADGDNRATLGLAGLAVRAGTRSTLATLWRVQDDSTTQLMKQFYLEFIQNGLTKAEALHRAQKALLENLNYQNPTSWASYILVGNWR